MSAYAEKRCGYNATSTQVAVKMLSTSICPSCTYTTTRRHVDDKPAAITNWLYKHNIAGYSRYPGCEPVITWCHNRVNCLNNPRCIPLLLTLSLYSSWIYSYTKSLLSRLKDRRLFHLDQTMISLQRIVAYPVMEERDL